MTSAPLNRVSNKALGQMLIEKGYITNDQCEQGLTLSKKEGIRLGEALLALGFVNPDVLSYALGEQFGVRPVQMDLSMVDPNLVRRFPLDLLRRHSILPFIEVGDELVVVIGDPNDSRGLLALSNLVPSQRISAQIGDARQIRRILDGPPFHAMSSGGFATTPCPTDWETTENVPVNEPNLAHWLVTSAIQRPDCDLLVRNDGRECRVLRRSFDTDGDPLEYLHNFSSAIYPNVREELWQNCSPISHTDNLVGIWNAPLRFAGKRFALEVALINDACGSAIRLRALSYEDHVHEAQNLGTGAVLGSVAIVFYESRARMEALLAKFLQTQPLSQSIVLFQETTRRVYDKAVTFPGLFTHIPRAIASMGATCVIFDHAVSAEELARARNAVTPFPAIVVCTQVNTRNESLPGKPAGLELRPKISPDIVDITRLYKPEVIYVGKAGDDVREMTSFSALEFLGVNK